MSEQQRKEFAITHLNPDSNLSSVGRTEERISNPTIRHRTPDDQKNEIKLGQKDKAYLQTRVADAYNFIKTVTVDSGLS